jgi:hypothetical protein
VAKQYLIPGEGYVNDTESGKEYLIPGLGYLNERPAAAGSSTLVVADLLESHTIGNVVLTQIHALAAGSLVHAHTIGALTLIQVHSLSVANLANTHTIGNVVLTQQHALALANLIHAHGLGAVELDTATQLIIASLAHGQSLSVGALTQQHVLSVAILEHYHTVSTIVLGGIAPTITSAETFISFLRHFDSVSRREADGMVEGTFEVQTGEILQFAHSFTPLMTADETLVNADVEIYQISTGTRETNTLLVAGSTSVVGQQALYGIHNTTKNGRYKVILTVHTSSNVAPGSPRHLVAKHLILGI